MKLKRIWLIEFLDQSDITYTSFGRKDHLYFRKFNGEKKYKQRQYLLWPLRDILPVANSNAGSEQSFETRFDKELTFSQLYYFLKLHKEYTFKSNIPYTSCLCKICGNSSLFAKGLNNRKKIFRERFPTNPHGLVEKFSCNSDEGNFMLEKCSL